MRSSSNAVRLAVIFCYLVIVTAVTEGRPAIDKRQHQDEMHTVDASRENHLNVNIVKENTIGLDADSGLSTKSRKKALAPMVDDDLLEFLVRVADNPVEWNKIQRVLSMLGRDEMSGTPSTAVKSTTGGRQPKKQPVTMPSPTTAQGSWPSGDWILETVEKINAAARARGIRAGGSTGLDPFDYDDDGDDEDDGTDNGDEIEEIDVGGDDPSSTTVPQSPPPPPPPRVAAGHMSRYQFRRIDGDGPDDGRVNGTYVAVVESDRPPRGVVYDPVRQKKPKPAK